MSVSLSFQILSRSKPAAGGGPSSSDGAGQLKDKKKKKLPKLEEFLQNRDYVGAITLLEVRCRDQPRVHNLNQQQKCLWRVK